MAVLTEAEGLLARFKDCFSKNDLKTAEGLLGQLKVKLIQLPSLPPASEPSATAQQELLLARDALEHAAMLAVKLLDDTSAERAFVQLRVFYCDTRATLPPSAKEAGLVGLNLLRLLVANRIAEFHTELEVIAPEMQAVPEVSSIIQLERWLMEGAYNKVLDASKQPPSDLHAALMTQLVTTVREEVASCMERAYKKLPVAAAQSLLMFSSAEEASKYFSQHEWSQAAGYITFKAGTGAASGGQKAVPPLELINNALVYAKELERIV